jgi:hypothetical protein
LTENGIAAGSAGLITVTAAPWPRPGGAAPASRPAIAGYSDLTGSIASHGRPAAASCSSRCRTVCDFLPGRTGHQGMPVHGRQRHAELAHRPVQAIEDRPEAERTGRLPGRPA